MRDRLQQNAALAGEGHKLAVLARWAFPIRVAPATCPRRCAARDAHTTAQTRAQNNSKPSSDPGAKFLALTPDEIHIAHEVLPPMRAEAGCARRVGSRSACACCQCPTRVALLPASPVSPRVDGVASQVRVCGSSAVDSPELARTWGVGLA